jgi:hypothetical protein
VQHTQPPQQQHGEHQGGEHGHGNGHDQHESEAESQPAE